MWSDDFVKLLYLILGWLLGLVGSVYYESIQRKRKATDFMAAALLELGNLEYKMAVAVHELNSHLGELTDEFYGWFLPIVERYEGVDRDETTIATIRSMANLSREERHRVWSRNNPSASPRPMIYFLPFIESTTATLSICPDDVQLRVSHVMSQLRMFNETVRSIHWNLEKTFDSALSSQNREGLLANLEKAYRNLIGHARKIIDDVTYLEGKYGDYQARQEALMIG